MFKISIRDGSPKHFIHPFGYDRHIIIDNKKYGIGFFHTYINKDCEKSYHDFLKSIDPFVIKCLSSEFDDSVKIDFITDKKDLINGIIKTCNEINYDHYYFDFSIVLKYKNVL